MPLIEIVRKASSFGGWSHAERIKLFAWYLHVHENKSRVSVADLRACYDDVHVERPENFSPYLKSLEARKPKAILRDKLGYYLERQTREELTKIHGGPDGTLPLSKLLEALPARVADGAERSFIEEALKCIKCGCSRAAIVLGWCAAIHRLRQKLNALGFPQFNAASARLKNQSTGKFKRWNKEFNVQTASELQAVFDTDLIIVIEGMGLIDSNQAQRLETLFQWRCHSAHPGDAPIGEAHVTAFFTDVVDIILANPTFRV